MYLRKNEVCWQNKRFFNKFNASTAPDFKQKQYYTEIYLKMQYAILPRSLVHKPRCSLCRIGQNLPHVNFVTIFGDQYQRTSDSLLFNLPEFYQPVARKMHIRQLYFVH